jgi:hypothetical protein
LIQRSLNKSPDRWDPDSGGGIHFDLKIGTGLQFGGRKNAGRVSRFESISILVASAVAIVWLTEVRLHPFLIFGPAAHFLKLAPIWSQAIPMMVGLTCLEIARAIINFIRPDWARFRAVFQVATGAAGLAIVGFLLSARTWVTLPDGQGTEKFGHVVQIVNQAYFYGLLVGAAICVAQLFFRISRLVREERKPASSSSMDVAC